MERDEHKMVWHSGVQALSALTIWSIRQRETFERSILTSEIWQLWFVGLIGLASPIGLPFIPLLGFTVLMISTVLLLISHDWCP